VILFAVQPYIHAFLNYIKRCYLQLGRSGK
jgi:hypothetical protein